MTICLACSTPLTHTQMLRHRKYCSRSCGGTARRATRKDVVCPCGVMFQVANNSTQVYCTKSHAAKYRIRTRRTNSVNQ